MGIFYLKEHSSCYNYTKCIREVFLYYKFLIYNLIYFLNETKKARYEKGQIKFSKTRNARKLNMSPGKVKFKTVLKEKLIESTLK